MPSLETNYLKKYIKTYHDFFFDCFPIFVETGTYKGQTTFAMEKIFKTIHTIEISEKYYDNVKSKYKGDKINFHLGDSSIILSKIVENINDNAIFFLDGHYMSKDSGKGNKDCPLIEELEIIMKKFKKNAIIIIDDFRLFGKFPGNGCNENWKDISKNKVLEVIKDRMELYYHAPSSMHPQDRLIIYLKNL